MKLKSPACLRITHGDKRGVKEELRGWAAGTGRMEYPFIKMRRADPKRPALKWQDLVWNTPGNVITMMSSFTSIPISQVGHSRMSKGVSGSLRAPLATHDHSM